MRRLSYCFFGFDLRIGQQCVGTDICKMGLPAMAGSTAQYLAESFLDSNSSASDSPGSLQALQWTESSTARRRVARQRRQSTPVR